LPAGLAPLCGGRGIALPNGLLPPRAAGGFGRLVGEGAADGAGRAAGFGSTAFSASRSTPSSAANSAANFASGSGFLGAAFLAVAFFFGASTTSATSALTTVF